MRNIDIDLYTKESEITASEENIIIEITGLKSINKFIGLDDTPLYYEDGKFFKVEGNKIVYTDVEWKDLKGNVTDNKDLIEQIEVNAEKSAKKYAGQIVASAIDVHNNDVNSHPYLLNTIEENYTILDKKIDDTKIELETSISDLDQKLSKDIDDLDIKLSGEIEDLNQDLSDEITNRENADIEINNSITQLDEKVDGININLTKQIDDLEQDVNDKYNELVRDIDDLTDVVEEDYAKLNTKIDTTAQTINTRITNVADELNQTIEENIIALQQEDTALQNQINTHSQTLTAHDTRITNNTNAITKEVGDRQSADENLQEQIDGITAGADVRDIVGTYAQLQAYDKSKLGDNDIIKVLQDETKENASTYYRFGVSTQSFTYIGKEGPFYTKSETDGLLNVKANDSAVVHLTGNETISGVKTFSSTPIISSGYLNLNNTGNVSIQKQGTNFIRQNATGATIISSSGTDNKIYLRPHGDTNQSSEVTIDSSGSVTAPKFSGPLEGTATKATQDASGNVITTTYATKTELEQAKSELGSELNYENSTLELLNNAGETLSSVTIKSTPDLDNKTINLNSDSQLQSVGSILQSGGYQKYWQGTKAEYDAIQVKDPDTLYEVLDDIVDIVTEIPTATPTDIGLVKPDNTTITVDDTGTLSVPSSFLLNHNSSNLAHVDTFNTKANVNLNNVSDNVDFVVESGTYGDSESGYKKFKSGYMLQHGKVTSSANGVVEFTLHKPYKNTNYSIFAQVAELGNFFVACFPSTNQKFKLRVQTSQSSNIAVRVSWWSVGYSA